MKFRLFSALLILFLLFSACNEEVLPKPNAKLRLQYSKPVLKQLETDYFSFTYNSAAEVKIKNSKVLSLKYPEMKGEIFINYKNVENNIEKLIANAQKLSYEHSAKADGIVEQPFVNQENNVYGRFFEVTGNAASQAQFYVTDSTKHFLTGSLYFLIKPNYDSIYPAAAYLQNDIRGIMETLRWKSQER
ncbi:MAG TPA: gliding motility lipoprotein GldD [Pricia antarctica]|uniref:Gliding motility lipoprotein GldD n=2 Tax=root TaxID=1 RepID=A0A831QKI2_9FLAO|nr:gliding motility lipoprotein GldD [Pricia antarctica]